MHMSTRVLDALPAPGCPLTDHRFEHAHLAGTPSGATRHIASDGIRLRQQALPPPPGFRLQSSHRPTTAPLASGPSRDHRASG